MIRIESLSIAGLILGVAHPFKHFSMHAVVDQPRDLATKFVAMNNAIDEAVFEQELARLEARGEFDFDRLFDDTRTRKADEGFWFGEDDVAEGCEASGDSPIVGFVSTDTKSPPDF